MKLHFRNYGKGEPLLILHGLFGSADNWNTLAKEFAKNKEVFVLDLRNHGLSPHSDEFSYEVMANDLNEFVIDHELGNKLSIIGHSMGGKVLMHYLSNYYATVNKAIVVDISPKYYPPHHHKVLEALHAVDFAQVKSRREVEQVISPILEDLATTQFILKNIYWKDFTFEENNQSTLAWRFNLESISKNIEEVGKMSPSIPSSAIFQLLFIAGSKSNYITNNDLNFIHEYYKKSVVSYIENAGHWVQAEQPKLFYEAVSNFLSNG